MRLAVSQPKVRMPQDIPVDAARTEPQACVQAQAQGLNSAEAAARLLRFGPNRLQPDTQRALLVQFLAHFKNPLVLGCWWPAPSRV